MTEKEIDIPIRKSERIAQIIAKANQVAAIDWLHAILEEHAEPARRDLAGLQALTALSEHPVFPAAEVKAIEAPKNSAKQRASQERWDRMSKKERAEQLGKMAEARWGAKKKSPKKSAAVSGYWASMTPAERSTEMKRRVAMSRQPEQLTLSERLKLHPRDKRSPKHADWLKMMANAQQKRFANMSVRKRKEWKAAMREGQQRSREQRVNGAIQ